LKNAAVQRGFYKAGMILAVIALLKKDSTPIEEEIKEYMRVIFVVTPDMYKS